MKIFYILSLVSVFVYIACADVQSSNNNIETEGTRTNETDDEKSDTKKTNGSKIKTGFYSGLSLGLKNHLIFGNFSTQNENETTNQKLNLDKSHLAVNLSIGGDKNFGSLVVGADVNVAFNPASKIEYPKKNNVNIANFKVGTEYLGFAKLGVAVGRFQFYGKLGGSLSHVKYDWQIDNAPKDKSNYIGSFVWGGGIEFLLSDHVMVNLNFARSNKTSVDKLNVKNKETKTADTTIASYQISMGCGYRF